MAKHEYLKSGFLNSHLKVFLQDLEQRGYAPLTAKGYADSVRHFAQWAQKRHLALDCLSNEVLYRFAKHRCRCPGGRNHRSVSPKYVRRVRRFIHHLRAVGSIAAAEPTPTTAARALLAEEFLWWLREHRGIGSVTVERYRNELAKLPTWFLNAHQVTAARIHALVLERASHQSASATQKMLVTLRMYLRFLSATSRCTAGLEGSVQSVPQWKLSALPRYLMADQVERLIATCDTNTQLWARDRAVLLLLARLGLRAGDVAGLRMEDIDWRAGRLKVCGKSHRESWLPLPQDAGDAILRYLSDVTIYAWRKRFGQLEPVDVKRLRQLEQENAKLKKLVAERDLEIDVMKEVAAKKW